MLIHIFARKRFSYSNRRFREEAKRLEFTLKVIDPSEYEIVLGRQSPLLFRHGKSVTKVGSVIPRMGASITNYALAVLSQFEMMGVPIVNRAANISRTRNKLRCLQLMSRHDIDIPRTVVASYPEDLERSIEMVGGFPVVVKLLSGAQGVGVMLAENMQTIRSTVDTLWSLGQDILIQECVKESVGRDVRVIVVGGKVIAAMRRQARIGEFRSNVHRGGVATPIELTVDQAKVALQAAQIVGLDVAGVDILESYGGAKVIEVNSSPGLEAIEKVTEVNIARAILEHSAVMAEEHRRFHRIDSEAE